jgi:hypothetical protein
MCVMCVCVCVCAGGRAGERAMERYVESREDAPWRPDLAQRVDDYHLGLLHHLGTVSPLTATLGLCTPAGYNVRPNDPQGRQIVDAIPLSCSSQSCTLVRVVC